VFRYPLQTAAGLAAASYDARRHASVAPRVLRSLDEDDVQAHMLDNRVLLIPGSNSVMDYLKFNLQVLTVRGKGYAISGGETERGASGTLWHKGFLRHAAAIFDWVEEHGATPRYIIGHSLGAAAAQILCMSWRVHGIGFAAPRPRRNPAPVALGRYCLLVNRDDDIVPKLPYWFHHMGRVHVAPTPRWRLLPGHAMPHYRASVAQELAKGRLPHNWPPVQRTSITPLSTAST
jgi:hypothetical protein